MTTLLALIHIQALPLLPLGATTMVYVQRHLLALLIVPDRTLIVLTPIF
jgi:hypothetical protein